MAFKFKIYETFGKIKQGKNEIRVQKVSWNGNPATYDIRVWSGDYALKGASYGPEALKRLKGILEDLFGNNAPLETPPKEEEPKVTTKKTDIDNNVLAPLKSEVATIKETQKTNATKVVSFSQKSESERIVHALASIPVNDGNYPINTATIEQIEEAIRIMEADTKGSHKTRLARCKAKLKSLRRNAESQKIAELPKATETAVTTEPEKIDIFGVDTEIQETDESTSATTEPETAEADEVYTASKTAKTADIIKFPKKDTTGIKRLAPSGEQHSYTEAETKLKKELEMFKGDRDSEYVINGLLELANVDQEFCNNVMRPDKSYVGAFQYFANKAKQGYCMMIGNNIGVMDADTALKYAIDYFNADLSKPESPKTKASNATTKVTAKKSRKAGDKK